MEDQGNLSLDSVTREFLERYTQLDPCTVARTSQVFSTAGHTNYSPAGTEQIGLLLDRTLEDLDRVAPRSREERIAKSWLHGYVTATRSFLRSDEAYYPVRLQDGSLRRLLDTLEYISPAEGGQRELALEFLAGLPAGVAGIGESLRAGLRLGKVCTVGEAEEFASYCSQHALTSPLFDRVVSQHEDPGRPHGTVTGLVDAAQRALNDLASFMYTEYLPNASEQIGVGAQRYGALADAMCLSHVDPLELYEQSWQRYKQTQAELTDVLATLFDGATLQEAVWRLDMEPENMVLSDAALLGWFKETLMRSADYLRDTHLLIPRRFTDVEILAAAPDSLKFISTIAPSGDFSNPGVINLRPLGELNIPTWRYVALCLYAGIPGTHYQNCYRRAIAQHLGPGQTELRSAFSESGWASYAMEIVDFSELFPESPGARLGQLKHRLLRDLHVLIDIGFNLRLKIPDDAPVCAGERWTVESGALFVGHCAHVSRAIATGEIRRAVHSPGHLIVPAVGGMAIHEARGRLEEQLGSSFSAYRFHQEVLDLGPLGLAGLEDELARLPMAETARNG
jgi:uncharacterized protein (DUF885 family)